MIKTNILGDKIESEAQGAMLTNKLGSYFFLSDEDLSKYQGFFFRKNNLMFKTLASLDIKDSTVEYINYTKEGIELIHNGFSQKFFIHPEENILIYETDSDKPTTFTFDCRESYDMSKFGRFYEVSKEDNVIIVKYKKFPQDTSTVYEIYTAILSQENGYDFVNNWIEKTYQLDKERSDSPTRALFEAFTLKTKKAIISSSTSKEEAIESVKKALDKLAPYHQTDNEIKIGNSQVLYSYYLSRKALSSLIVKPFMYAGLPWFFQFWSRDSAFSIRSLFNANAELTKNLIFYYLNELRDDGLIPNRIPKSGLDSIDAVGVLFYRIKELLPVFSEEELNQIYSALKKSVESIIKFHSQESLIINKEYETWMDTQKRDGARIEIQALFLSMLSLLSELSERFNDDQTNAFAIKKQDEMLNLVRSKFLIENKLKDGSDDSTIRPNIFLAYYFFPDLLSIEEWEHVFDYALDSLWLTWGGISTIDKKDPRFCSRHTGIDNRSYHDGDSWFFINNLVAITLIKLNKKKYETYIVSLIKSSTQEILESGIFGYHAELSSAEKLESNGCLAQAWSSALYTELIETLDPEVFRQAYKSKPA